MNDAFDNRKDDDAMLKRLTVPRPRYLTHSRCAQPVTIKDDGVVGYNTLEVYCPACEDYVEFDELFDDLGVPVALEKVTVRLVVDGADERE